MARKLFDHMIEKANPGRNIIMSGAVEIYLDRNFGFLGVPVDRGGAHGRRYKPIKCQCKCANLYLAKVHLDFKTRSVHQGAHERRRGLPGDHHFYITFKTRAAGVAIPVHLMERFPDEMTIVMQHKYWDLKVGEDYFEVGLSFSQVPAHLHIPFSAITAFVDPAVDFALQFHVDAESGPEPHEQAENDGPSIEQEDGSNVVTVDFGRKK